MESIIIFSVIAICHYHIRINSQLIRFDSSERISGSLIAHEYLCQFKCNEKKKTKTNKVISNFQTSSNDFLAYQFLRSPFFCVSVLYMRVYIFLLTYRIVTLHPIGYTSSQLHEKHGKHFNINFKLTTTNKFMNQWRVKRINKTRKLKKTVTNKFQSES